MLAGGHLMLLRSTRHDYRRPFAETCCRRRPSCLLRSTSGRSRECHAPRRRRGARRRPHHDGRSKACSAKRTFSIVFVSMNGRSGGRMDRSSRAIYRIGLSLFRNRTLIRTTNAILRIRTAARRFLTKTRRCLRGSRQPCAPRYHGHPSPHRSMSGFFPRRLLMGTSMPPGATRARIRVFNRRGIPIGSY
jgi:hypothetical protein